MVVGGAGKVGDGFFHMGGGVLDEVLGFLVFREVEQLVGHFKRLVLAFQDDGSVLGQSGGFAAQFPGGVDDLLLELDQLLRFFAQFGV